MQNFLRLLINLRYDLIRERKARRQRFRIFDRISKKTVAKFDNEKLAETVLDDLRKEYLKEITNELTKAGIPVA